MLIDDQLTPAVLIPVGVCTGLGISLRMDALDDLQISAVSGFRIQQRVVLVVEVYAVFRIQKHVFAVRQTLDAQIQQGIHQMAGIDAGPHIADAPLPLKNRGVHGEDHAAGPRRFHDAQVGQLPLGQNRLLEGFQRIPLPGGDPDGPLGGMGQDVGFRRGNIQPFENPLDGGEVLRILLRPFEQSRIVRVQKELPHLAAQGEGGHILLGRGDVIVDDRGPGLHGVGHLVGDIALDHRGGVGGHNQPEQQHAGYCDGGCNDANARCKPLVCQRFHKLSSAEKRFLKFVRRTISMHIGPPCWERPAGCVSGLVHSGLIL